MTFPAYAGGDPCGYRREKVRKMPGMKKGQCAFPRIRGGDPYELRHVAEEDVFSPHTRG